MSVDIVHRQLLLMMRLTEIHVNFVLSVIFVVVVFFILVEFLRRRINLHPVEHVRIRRQRVRVESGQTVVKEVHYLCRLHLDDGRLAGVGLAFRASFRHERIPVHRGAVEVDEIRSALRLVGRRRVMRPGVRQLRELSRRRGGYRADVDRMLMLLVKLLMRRNKRMVKMGGGGHYGVDVDLGVVVAEDVVRRRQRDRHGCRQVQGTRTGRASGLPTAPAPGEASSSARPRGHQLAERLAARLAAVLVMPEALAGLESLLAAGTGVRPLVRVSALVCAHRRRVFEPLAAHAAFLAQLVRVFEQNVLLEMVALFEPVTPQPCSPSQSRHTR